MRSSLLVAVLVPMFAVPAPTIRTLRRTRIVKTVAKAVSVVLIAASVTALAEIQPAPARQLPRQPIVHGQNLQPRQRDLDSLGLSDTTPSQAAEIDKLYRELLHCGRCGVPTGPSANG